MKFKVIKCIAFIGIAVIIFSSCGKNLLDVPAYGKVIVDSVNANNPVTANAEIKNAYAPVGWTWPAEMSTFMALNISSDEAVHGGSTPSDVISLEQADKRTLNPVSRGSSELWKRFYKGVFRCNKFIEDYSTSAGLSSDSIKRYIAEAKYLRAFYYFHLVNLFGEVPIPLSQYDLEVPQSTLSQVYDQIEKDLLEAISGGLPASKANLSYDDLVLSRATVYTAKAFLGKVYVFHSTMLKQDKWNEAYEQLNAVYMSNEYQLVPDYRKIFHSNFEMKDGNPESIITTSYYDESSMDWNNGHNPGNLDIQYCGIRGLTKKIPNAYGPLTSGWGFCRPTQKFVKVFLDGNDSIRLDETVWDLKRIIAEGGTVADPYEATGYAIKKYSSREAITSPIWQYPQDYIVYRYAEVLLLLAETEYNRGHETEARSYLNEVRMRAKMGPKDSSGNALFVDIIKERQLELGLEGVRYWDLIRWGLASKEIQEWKPEQKGLWPIHIDDITVNPSMKQNPGY